MTVKVTAYKCDWCGGHLRRKKKSVEGHETRCFANPARKACKTCAHFNREFIEDSHTDYGTHGHNENYCAKEIDISTKMKFNCNSWGMKP